MPNVHGKWEIRARMPIGGTYILMEKSAQRGKGLTRCGTLPMATDHRHLSVFSEERNEQTKPVSFVSCNVLTYTVMLCLRMFVDVHRVGARMFCPALLFLPTFYRRRRTRNFFDMRSDLCLI